MKIDMSPLAITRRLKQVNQLRRTCLALANSSNGLRIRRKHAAKHAESKHSEPSQSFSAHKAKEG